MGFLVYRGQSMLVDDDCTILGILIEKTENEKMKNAKKIDVPQLYIIGEEYKPQVYVENGTDDIICGDCPYRSGNGCYVLPFHGPRAVWEAYVNGKYGFDSRKGLSQALVWLFKNKDKYKFKVRLGAYGDPAALPSWVTGPLSAVVNGRLSYSHQWEDERFQHLKHYTMASVDSIEQKKKAQNMGWATFRVRLPGQSILPDEIQCPADKIFYEGKPRSNCAMCGLCQGTSFFWDKRKNGVSIVVHGSRKKRAQKVLEKNNEVS